MKQYLFKTYTEIANYNPYMGWTYPEIILTVIIQGFFNARFEREREWYSKLVCLIRRYRCLNVEMYLQIPNNAWNLCP